MVAQSYEDGGDDLLESFVDRHEADISDNGRGLRQLLAAAASWASRVREKGTETQGPKKLSYLLKTQVMPMGKSVIRASNRQKAAHGKRDHIPGRASEAQDRHIVNAKQQVQERVEAEIRAKAQMIAALAACLPTEPLPAKFENMWNGVLANPVFFPEPGTE